MDRDGARAWLDRYVKAWESYEQKAIAELFSEDAEYRYHPYDEVPVRGRDAIVAGWLEDRDRPNTYEASYEPIAVDGDTVVATGTSTYLRSDGSVDLIYDNCFVMRFDDSGTCREFTEWYMKRPK